ncbi:ATP-binding cassette domain-containing protein [Vagococcus hydrophili]|uniref:ABC transporter ATP-binding protein n=1 Tax=Vagococcus hydrophili TaxID=2714947 RepID=A0A6G8AQK5_9ENTE|nr:ABC transporter ATP-binding protein [Vagococcus hydrophili]QIL47270.1 ABC transporter ATP-binding protein [Vagococcus hydrophili]
MSLEIKNIDKNYKDKKALDNITITIEPNKIYGLLGRNGAGKSTLLNVINNRSVPSSGDVLLDGNTLLDNEVTLNQVYLMSEDNLFPSTMKVKDMFKISEQFYGSFDWDLAEKMLEEFELTKKTTFKKLSTGYRSIAKLIIALCVPCDYIFLDEPVLGLDAAHRELFYEFLIETYETSPRTFIISTHLIEEITNLLESVIIIDKGKVSVAEDVSTILETSFTLSGPKTSVLAAVKDSEILGQEELGDFISVHITGQLPDNFSNDISVSPLNLQNYFVQLTKRK